MRLLGGRATAARALRRRSRRGVRVRLRDRRPCATLRTAARPIGKWGALVEDWLERMLPADVSACDGTIKIAVTRMVPLPHPVRVRRFADAGSSAPCARRRTYRLPRRPAALAARGRDRRRRTAVVWPQQRRRARRRRRRRRRPHRSSMRSTRASWRRARRTAGPAPHGTDAFIRYGAEFMIAQASGPTATSPRSSRCARAAAARPPAGRVRAARAAAAALLPPGVWRHLRSARDADGAARSSCSSRASPRALVRVAGTDIYRVFSRRHTKF